MCSMDKISSPLCVVPALYNVHVEEVRVRIPTHTPLDSGRADTLRTSNEDGRAPRATLHKKSAHNSLYESR